MTNDFSTESQFVENYLPKDGIGQCLFNSSTDCVKLLDVDGRLKSMNPNGKILMEVSDFSKVENQVWADFWGEKSNLARNAIETAKQGGTGRFEGLCPTAAGTMKWWDVVVTPVYGPSGNVQAFLSISRDISDRKQMEEALIHSNEELQRFAYVVSHDLQAPLRHVANYSDLLDHQIGKSDSAGPSGLVSKIRASVSRLQLMVKDLVAFATLDKQMEKENVDLAALIDGLVTDFNDTLRDQKASVVRGQLPTVQANAGQIYLLFQNLISNAVKFRTDDKPVVKINATKADGEWLVTVEDNGIGIPEADRLRVFTVFNRLHGAGKYPGSGMGLSICKKIIDRHNGRIWVEKPPTGGSTFIFTLPAEPVSSS